MLIVVYTPQDFTEFFNVVVFIELMLFSAVNFYWSVLIFFAKFNYVFIHIKCLYQTNKKNNNFV